MKITFTIVSILLFSFLSYAQIEEENLATISLDSLLNVKISSASKYWQTTFEAPSSVSIISSEDIERFGYQTVGDALASLGGFYLSYDRNYAYLGVRGFSRPTDYNNRVLLMINDHPINENVFGSSSIGTELGISLSSVERIEVVRGPGSSLYGTGAMFSVINIVTKNGGDFDKANFAIATGSFNQYSTSLNLGKTISDDWEFFLSAKYFEQKGKDIYFAEFDDPSTNSGVADDLDRDKYWGMCALLKYKRTKLQFKYSAREKFFPTASYGIDFNHPNSKTNDNFGFIEASHFIPIKGNDEITVKLSLDRYYYTGNYPYNNLISSDEAIGMWGLFNVQYYTELSSASNFIAGIEYKENLESRYRLVDNTGESFNKNILTSVKSFYAQNEFQPLPTLTLLASIRYDGYTGESALFSPRGAIVFNAFQYSVLKIVYGTAYRAPNTYELYYEDVPTNFKLSSGLEPEKITTLEFIYQQKFSDVLSGTISLYNYRVTNLIDQYFDDTDSSLQFRNFNKASANGAELNLNYYPNKNIKTYLRYSYQYAQDDEAKTHMSNSPKHLFRGGAAVPCFNLFYLSPEVAYESNRQTVYGTLTEDFIKVDLTLVTQTFYDDYSLAVTIKNLFNKTYAHPGGFEHVQNAIVQDGRSFLLRLQKSF